MTHVDPEARGMTTTETTTPAGTYPASASDAELVARLEELAATREGEAESTRGVDSWEAARDALAIREVCRRLKDRPLPASPAGLPRWEEAERWKSHGTLCQLIEQRPNPDLPSDREILEHVRIYRDQSRLKMHAAADAHWKAITDKLELLHAAAVQGVQDREDAERWRFVKPFFGMDGDVDDPDMGTNYDHVTVFDDALFKATVRKGYWSSPWELIDAAIAAARPPRPEAQEGESTNG